MTILIFAGGAGTRLWPLSRKNSPKQFAKIAGDQSTLQLAVDRVRSFGLEHVYISTNESYLDFIAQQVPELEEDHTFSEPDKRDLAAAVCLSLFRLKRKGISGPVSILWSDHFVEDVPQFEHALTQATEYVHKHPDQFVFMGETPRFANHNLGWMHVGEELSSGVHSFLGWKYRPELSECTKMFESGRWVWNPGYFTFDLDTCVALFKQFQPELYSALDRLVDDPDALKEEYNTLPAISFDEAIIEHLQPEQAVVLPVNMQWSDPGTLYAFKEAFAPNPEENFSKGSIVDIGSRDSFIYNEVEGKVLATIGLDGMCVVNTSDAMLVCKKEDVPRIKELLKKIEEEGYTSSL